MKKKRPFLGLSLTRHCYPSPKDISKTKMSGTVSHVLLFSYSAGREENKQQSILESLIHSSCLGNLRP